MTTLSWYKLAELPEGTRVVFEDAYDIFPECLVPAGTTATIKENGLNEIWCAMLVLPDSERLRSELSGWEGAIYLNPDADPGDSDDPRWQKLSPLSLEGAP